MTCSKSGELMIRKALIFFLPIAILIAAVFMVIAFYSGRQSPAGGALSPLFIATALAVSLALLTLMIWLAVGSIMKPLDKLAETMQLFLEGNWEQRAGGEALSATDGLGELFNQMADEQAEMQRSLTLRKEENGASIRQAVIKLGELVAAAPGTDQLLNQALEVIVERFECDYGAIYVVERAPSPAGKLAVRQSAYGDQQSLAAQLPGRMQADSFRIESLETKDWPIAQAVTSGHSRVGSLQFGGGDEVHKVFEAAVPIMQSGQVLAAIDLYALGRRAESRLGPFSTRTISELEAFANLIAMALLQVQPSAPSAQKTTPDPDQIDFRLQNLLYRAGGQILRARSRGEALATVSGALKQAPFPAALLLANGDKLELAPPVQADLINGDIQPPESTWIPVGQTAQFFSRAVSESGPFLILENLIGSYLPQGLSTICSQMGFTSAAFIPAPRGFGLAALLILGQKPQPGNGNGGEARLELTQQELGPYKYLLEQLATTLERLDSTDGQPQQGAELQTLWNISQAIAVETNLEALYRTIHQQVVDYMGEFSSFAIALYNAETDTIKIPYMYEEGQTIDIPPFPLGEGLTSIVIHSRKPLMIVENAVQEAEALGAKLVGEPAKSWLGVPLLHRSQPIGVMIAQDIQHEQRFNLDDQRLLSALASQVAIIVRNATLYQTSQKATRHERLVNKISDRIRHSTDIKTIMKTAAEELGAALNLESAHIEIQLEAVGDDPTAEQFPQAGGNGSDPHPGQSEAGTV